MTARIPCCVPHCRRTAPLAKHPNATEVICAKHYRAVPLMWRRLHKRLQKKLVAAWDKHHGALPPGDEGSYIDRMLGMDDKLWERIKGRAIDRAGGIA